MKKYIKKHVKIIMLLIILLMSTKMRANEFTIISCDLERDMSAKIEKLPDKALYIDNFNIQGNLPFVGRSFAVIFSPFYQNYNVEKASNTLYDFDNLTTAGAAFILKKDWSQHVSTISGFVPKYAGDLNHEFDSEYFTFNLLQSVNFKYNERISYGLGLYFIYSFNHPIYLPIINLDWKINSRTELDASFPDYIDFRYKINDYLKTGISMKFFASQYRIHNLSGNSLYYYYRYYTGSIGPFFNVKFWKHLNCNISAGYNIINKYDFIVNDDIIDYNLKSNPFVKLGFSYSVDY